jgi:hypothetical protein
MRRRLWLVIIQLDSRAAELSGSGFSIITQPWDTKPPLNVNDCDLYPDMREPPAEQDRATEMMLVLLRAQIGVFLTKEKPVIDTFDGVFSRFSDSTVHMVEKNHEIDELEQMLEERLVRHCDQQIPLHHITSIIARAAICRMRLFAHLPRVTQGSASQESISENSTLAEDDLLFTNSLQILEYHIQIRTTASLRRFLWDIHFQWQALIYLLAYLRTHPNHSSRTETAWTTVDKLFTSHPELIRRDRTRSKLCNAVSILTLKAWEARVNEPRSSNSAAPVAPPPSCIAWLQEQGFGATRAATDRVPVAPEEPLPATMTLQEKNQTMQAHAWDHSNGGGELQNHELATLGPNIMLGVDGGHPSTATNAFTIRATTTADLSWIDANPMDWENWNSIYEDFEMQDQWGDLFDPFASFPEP